ncbi:hypothetical protein VitviT2T_003854 [Vitis vinifera]|uniref:Uncharacterized protein n=1 Tax=Vitis vinifera TaxID=29760 RepID=A0ABY9BMQ9_VITVI|nr:hypothetical protein VitviT2T_003854 [Vitis vinifera]
MCGCDDHLAWKRPVSPEACRGLRTTGGVLDSFSVVTGPRAEIDDMMVMIFSEHIEIRLLQLRFTMSDEIASITLITLYEMMVDLTQRVERMELILSEHPSSSRGAPGVAMPSLPRLASLASVTLGASHPRPSFRLRDPPVITFPDSCPIGVSADSCPAGAP